MTEPLETRIAPATFTFIDVDGDDVTIKTSKGSDDDLKAMGVLVFSDMNAANPRQLLEIDLSKNAGAFEGTSLSVIAKRSAARGGDGHVNVGYIDAVKADGDVMFANEGLPLNLGKVFIDGDLGQIDAGTAGALPAVQSLDVVSMGRFGLTTQSSTNDSADCTLDGRIGALVVRTDFIATNIDSAQIGAITIGGALVGTSRGHIKAGGSIGAVKIGGDVIGGFDDLAGTITSAGSIKSVFVGGSVLGGDDSIGGHANSTTGAIVAAGNIGPVTIRGSLRAPEEILFGGAASGVISAGGNLGAVRIGGDLVGSTITSLPSDNSIDFTGTVRAGGAIKSVFIGGSIIAGYDLSGIGDRFIAGGIAAGKNIGSITVLGSIRGQALNLPESNALIFAGVADAAIGGKLASIGKIVVKGSVEYAEIRAGVTAPGTMSGPNLDAQIGSVSVGGNWVASELSAGIAMVGSDTLALTSRIGGIKIAGAVLGDFAGGTSFSFKAEEIGSFSVGGEAIPLKKGARNDLAAIAIGATGDVTLAEVP